MRSSGWLLVIIALVVAVTACAPAGTQGAVSADETERSAIAAAAKERTWIDVRTPGEYDEGHLAGALNIDLQATDFRQQIAELPRDGSYLVYCRSGNRSAAAARIMAELGFEDVLDGGGFAELVEAGLPEA